MINQETLEKYASLALETGVNLQKDQMLVINAPIEGADFTRLVAKKAYELGAKHVHINWSDDELSLLRFTYAPDEVLGHVPDWMKDQYDWFAENDSAVLSIYSSNPDLLQDIDPARVALAQKASAEAMKKFRTYTMNDRITWSIISIPTGDWAQKIFPDATREEAIANLWDAIVRIVRVDKDDPIAAWEEHNETLRKARAVLNERNYSSLRLTAPGTDLEIGLPENHIWHGGDATSEKGIVFNPNMPTEEVFSAPDKYNVNGTVSSTMPLNYGGGVIDEFTLTFKDGKVVDFSAKQGEDILKHLLDTDEGARRLGEIALVPDESPISQSGLVFYNTLYDENASVHIALGKAYPTNVKNGENMDDEQLDEAGINDSLTHVDFMIGSDKMDIDGVYADGKTEAVFRNGTWAIDVK